VKKGDLSVFGLVEFRPDVGAMFFKDRRMVMLSASGFEGWRSYLVKILGEKEGRKAVIRFGYREGFFSSLGAQSLFGRHEGFVVAPRLEEIMGILKAEVHSVCEDPSAFESEVHHYNSVEAEQSVLFSGPSKTPVCWWATGFASGYCQAERGLEVYYKETECAACGCDHCVVVGRDAGSWKDELQEFREDYGFRDFADVEDCWKELRQRYSVLVSRRETSGVGCSPSSSMRNVALRKQTLKALEEGQFIVREETMLEILDQAVCVARLNTPVLIQGETGTGKEFFANLIHEHSARGRQELVSVNCAALTESLLESELFGHTRGSFTGAVTDKPGLFELAANGTLFLDEIGEMPLALQAKLLRAIENGEIRRVGSNKTLKVNPRIIAATNRNLQALSAAGKFREDLYFRLNSFVIQIPPLRERRDSIPAMVQQFLHEISRNFDKTVSSVSPDAMARIISYHWPGNVRELKHALERAVVVTRYEAIQVRDLPYEIASSSNVSDEEKIDLKCGEKQIIATTLAEHRGNRTATAHALNISMSTLWRKMKRYGLMR